MASTDGTNFKRSLVQFQSSLTEVEEQRLKDANLKDVEASIKKIQVKLGREKRLCNLNRIKKFLDAMKHVEDLVAIFLNVSEFVAFIWGPIKLALMVATTWANSIKQLLDVYEDIGEALSNLNFFHELIKSKEHIKQAMEDYFSHILRFHRCVLNVFSQDDWKAFFKTTLGGFRHKVEPIIQALKRRQEKLSHERLQAHAIHEGVQNSREHADGRFDTLAADLDSIKSSLASESLRLQTSAENREMKESLEDKLNISKFGSHSRLDSPEPSSSSAGDWIFHHPDFQAWEKATSSQRNVLFLNGSPGAGKTILAMKIIRYLTGKDPIHGSTVYFFFRHDDDDRKSAKSMLRAILSQLIEQDETIMRHLYEKSSRMSRSLELSRLRTLQGLAQDCLTSPHSVSIVLDGLDECGENESDSIVSWFLSEVLPSAASRGCHLKLLVCGQRDGRLDQLLSAHPQIRLDTIGPHQRDIEEYSKSQAVKICAKFKRTPEQGEKLAAEVAKTSKGMFLYAKVVMSNFLSMCTIKEFENEMRSSTVPEDLDQAYERIVQRILGEAKSSKQKAAKQILGWTICSKRPLRWREIQSRFCIDAERGTCDATSQILDSCKEICGSLVDVASCDWFRSVPSEEIIHMVHETAGKYLVQRRIIDLLQQHADMALFCCRYLSSRPFLQHAESDNFQNALRSGYFGLLDYATVHYSDHVREAQKPTSNLPAEVVTSAMGLLTAYSDNHSEGTILEMEACAQIVTNTLRAENIDARILSRVVSIRTATESQHENLSKEDAYLDLSGSLRFKCSRLCCPKFTTGFENEDTRNNHLDRHERPYRCIYPGCFHHDVGSESLERLEAHYKAFHPDTVSLPPFPSTKDATPKDIFEACKQGNLELVKKFHLAGARIDMRSTNDHITPLYLATQGKHAKVCEYLAFQGANPFQSKKYGSRLFSPMYQAIQQVNAPLIELFLHARRDVKDEIHISHYPQYIAASIGENLLEVLELFPRLAPLIDHATLVKNVFRNLLGRQWQPEWSRRRELPADSSLLHRWYRREFPDIYHGGISGSGTNRLIKRHDSAEYRTYHKSLLRSGDRLLHKGLGAKCHPLSMFLLDFAGEDDLQLTDERGRLPAHVLAETSCFNMNCEKCPVIWERLIQVGGAASVNTPTNGGILPIHMAIRMTIPTRSIQTLISHTNNLNHQDDEGMSPIFYGRSPIRTSMLLATHRVDLSITNNQGQTVFSSASENHRIDVETLEVLLEADLTLAWTSDVSKDRETPLHHAMKRAPGDIYQTEKAKLLLSLPKVEKVLHAFSASPVDDNASACKKLREFARDQGLEAAIEVMDRIGFGL